MLTTLCSGCGETPAEVVVCPSDLQYRVSPDAATLNVGQSFTAAVTALGCGGTKVLEPPRWIWRSSDSLVIRVDSATGRATGQSAGAAVMYPTWSARGGAYNIPVTVLQ